MAARGSWPPPAKRSRHSVVDALRVDTGAACVACGQHDSPVELMGCRQCGNKFHPACVNLPAVPEEGGACFCRWSCFAAFHKRAPPRGPLGDFPRLVAQVHAMLREKAALGRNTAPPAVLVPEDDCGNAVHAAAEQPQQLFASSSSSSSANGHVPTRRPSRPASAALTEAAAHATQQPPRALADAYGGDQAFNRGDRPHSGRFARKPRGGRSVSPSPSRDATSYNNNNNSSGGGRSGNALASADAVAALRSHRSFSRASSESEYPDAGFRAGAGPDNSFARDKGNNPGSGRSSASPGAFAPVGAVASAAQPPVSQASDAFTQRTAAHGQGQQLPPSLLPQPPPPSQSRLPMLRSVGSRREFDDVPAGSARPSRSSQYAGSSSHGSLDGSTSSLHARRYGDGPPGGRYPVESQARASSPFGERERGPAAAAVMAPSNGKAAFAASAPLPPSQQQQQQQQQPPAASRTKEVDVPWLNPSAFPSTIYDRFKCHADDLNRVFRVDLTRAFADKTTHLFQSEIDFFFRCFESSDVSLVVNGMASDLNPCMWSWPFILESCGTGAQFVFDHFQYKKRSHDGGLELEYVGALKLSLGDYSQYLEKYLSNSSGKEAIVLEDHAKKAPVTIVAADNVIALNTLVIAQSCTKLQLYSDLKNSFQWDVFAGGIHCLLQYLPESCRKDKFASPLFHLTFPGARGALCDPGNGTTDSAYQRMEPENRDEFVRILRRAGYQAERKPMLQEFHLRALSSAGFVWTTVKIHDGEFIHINKGRMHFWRAVSRAGAARSVPNEPCAFVSWEWVYQGVSQRGISNECWFAMKNASLCSGGWAFDPRRAIIEAAKTGVATVRSGQFLTSRRGGLPQLLSFCGPGAASAATIDSAGVSQRRMQMVLFLESILQCLKTIVDDEYDLALGKDDSDAFGKCFDGEAMWKLVDTSLARSDVNDLSAYECGICGLELTNIYKQCLGCTAYASASQPNMSYKLFRLCLRCHAHPKHHHFKPRALHAYYGKLLSCEGHTGAPQSALDPRFFECPCSPSLPCAYCGGCQSCSCVCHTQFQTRFRFALPEALDHLRFDVDEVIKFHTPMR
ncbi:hypothetical protein PybrP1_000885 [[Pythium] brassicae (nom. inval.)]|nr:hypothetical protein PybrP1_000885 [[Pythium] brassicae (nom. inval.)]